MNEPLGEHAGWQGNYTHCGYHSDSAAVQVRYSIPKIIMMNWIKMVHCAQNWILYRGAVRAWVRWADWAIVPRNTETSHSDPDRSACPGNPVTSDPRNNTETLPCIRDTLESQWLKDIWTPRKLPPVTFSRERIWTTKAEDRDTLESSHKWNGLRCGDSFG